MGLDRHSLNYLYRLKDYTNNRGLDGRILTLGRQGLHEEKSYLINTFPQCNPAVFDSEYAEDWLISQGAKVVESIDYSEFEGATHIHDMNLLLEKPEPSYDYLIDAGTLEHIFHFPNAIQNCMSLIKEGGYFISFYPTDNLSNHGFYQFSPELFFRVFSEENGWIDQRCFLYQEVNGSKHYEIRDPRELNRRAYFNTSNPTMGFFIAKKKSAHHLSIKNIFQSDYAARWDGKELNSRTSFRSGLLIHFKNSLNKGTRQWLRFILNRILLALTGWGIRDKEAFKSVKS